MEVEQWVTLILLIVNSVIDIKKKKISIISVAVCFLCWLMLGMKERQWADLIHLVPGLVLLFISIVTRGALGMGDGILVCVMGLFCEWDIILWTLVFAFFMSFFWAIVQVCLQTKKDKTFPFVPFILFGYVLVLLF